MSYELNLFDFAYLASAHVVSAVRITDISN